MKALLSIGPISNFFSKMGYILWIILQKCLNLKGTYIDFVLRKKILHNENRKCPIQQHFQSLIIRIFHYVGPIFQRSINIYCSLCQTFQEWIQYTRFKSSSFFNVIVNRQTVNVVATDGLLQLLLMKWQNFNILWWSYITGWSLIWKIICGYLRQCSD